MTRVVCRAIYSVTSYDVLITLVTLVMTCYTKHVLYLNYPAAMLHLHMSHENNSISGEYLKSMP